MHSMLSIFKRWLTEEHILYPVGENGDFFEALPSRRPFLKTKQNPPKIW